MKYIGAHMHIAGGLEHAVFQAHALEATAFALFTKNQRRWEALPLTEEQTQAFRTAAKRFCYAPRQILPHDSYLINMGHPEKEKREKALAAFIDEMKRCAALGLDRLNFHPGSHLGRIGIDACIKNVAACIDRAVEQVPSVMPVIETTAGQGTNIGSSFAQIRDIIGESSYEDHIGVCIDTCNIFAAGYDLRTKETYGKTFEEFGRIIGFSRLKGMHLNDAKNGLASHVDRHASLGEGEIGKAPFVWIMQDERFADIPCILETPDEQKWKTEIAFLRNAADHGNE